MGKGEMLGEMVDDVSLVECRRGVNSVEDLQIFRYYG